MRCLVIKNDNLIRFINMDKVKKIYYDSDVKRVRIFFDGEKEVGEMFYLNPDLIMQLSGFGIYLKG